MSRSKPVYLLVVIVLALAVMSCSLPGRVTAPTATEAPADSGLQSPTEAPVVTEAPETNAPETDAQPADYAGVALTAQDLPAGFEELSDEDLEDMGISPDTFADAFAESLSKAEVQDFSAFLNVSDFEVIFDFVLAPVTLIERASFDLLLNDPTKAAESFEEGAGVPIEVVPMETVGDSSVLFTFTQASSGITLRVDVVISRRGEAVLITMVMYMDGQTPLVSAHDAAVILDGKARAVQGK
ncbi:MAG TPA: hypothetical protein PK454_05435 [Anaerolineaceae bacterium]|nr:hypothetical protein [Anaerolineaceae bacterium]